MLLRYAMSLQKASAEVACPTWSAAGQPFLLSVVAEEAMSPEGHGTATSPGHPSEALSSCCHPDGPTESLESHGVRHVRTGTRTPCRHL